LNKLGANVLVETMAVADRVTLTILYPGTSTAEASLQPREHVAGRVVPTCDLDTYFELLDWPCVDFIKMDIEGAESLAIQGCTKVIERCRPMVLIEAHGEVARDGLLALQAGGYHFKRWDVKGNILTVDWSESIGHEHWFAQYGVQQE
jgi:hypothetical protein